MSRIINKIVVLTVAARESVTNHLTATAEVASAFTFARAAVERATAAAHTVITSLTADGITYAGIKAAVKPAYMESASWPVKDGQKVGEKEARKGEAGRAYNSLTVILATAYKVGPKGLAVAKSKDEISKARKADNLRKKEEKKAEQQAVIQAARQQGAEAAVHSLAASVDPVKIALALLESVNGSLETAISTLQTAYSHTEEGKAKEDEKALVERITAKKAAEEKTKAEMAERAKEAKKAAEELKRKEAVKVVRKAAAKRRDARKANATA